MLFEERAKTYCHETKHEKRRIHKKYQNQLNSYITSNNMLHADRMVTDVMTQYIFFAIYLFIYIYIYTYG